MSHYKNIYIDCFDKEINHNEDYIKTQFLQKSNRSLRFNVAYNDLYDQVYDRKLQLEKQIENIYPGCIEVFEIGRKKYSKDEIQNALGRDLKTKFNQLKNSSKNNFEDLIEKLAIRDANYETILILSENYNNYETLYELGKLSDLKLLRVNNNSKFAVLIENARKERFGVNPIINEFDGSKLKGVKSPPPLSNEVARLRSDIEQLDLFDKCILLHCCYLSLSKFKEDFKLTEFIRIVSICNDIYDDRYFLSNAQDLTNYKKINQGINYSKVSITKRREIIDNLIRKIENLTLESTTKILRNILVNIK